MRPRRPFTLPIDPWPQAALAERLAVTVVLMMLLLLPFFAVGAALILVGTLALHAYRSYDLGASLRALIDRGAGWNGRGAERNRRLVRVDVPTVAQRRTV